MAFRMTVSKLRLIKQCKEWLDKKKINEVPSKRKGIYVLFKRESKNKYDVVYIGMTEKSMRRRLKVHARSKRKGTKWTHFSVFEVRDKIKEDEIKELEGILRHIYRKDTSANRLNKQRRFKPLLDVRKDLEDWR